MTRTAAQHVIARFAAGSRRAILGAALCILPPTLVMSSGPVAAQDKVVAKVNGRDITEADLKFAEAEIGNDLGSIPPDKRRRVLVEYLIENHLLAEAAETEKLGSGPAFDERLKYWQRRAMRDAYFDRSVKGAVSEADARKLYDAQVAAVKPQEEVRARHILVETEAKAKEAFEKIAHGSEFSTIAKEVSKDPGSGPEGGDLGYFGRGQMVPQFEETAFKLKVGEISQPVQSQFGWHIIKVEDRRQKNAPPFEQIKDQIVASMVHRKALEVTQSLRAKAKLEFVDPALKAQTEEENTLRPVQEPAKRKERPVLGFARGSARLTGPGARGLSPPDPTLSRTARPRPNVTAQSPKPLTSSKAGPLQGVVRVPGDKSISHRSLIFGALATGITRVSGLLEAEDVVNTAHAVTALGAPATKRGDVWEILGRGVGGLLSPKADLDFGNSGTGSRLMMGVVAGNDITARFVGDASLSRRPMRRVLTPLRQMGLEVLEDRETLPLTLRGSSHLMPIEYATPVPSAQVKSAVLLAGLGAAGETTVIEKEATRDHTERMLRFFGADVKTTMRDGKVAITVKGQAELAGRDVTVPGDPSSAAFLAAAAAIVPGSDVTIEGVLVNATRTGFYTTLREMGANVVFRNERDEGGEPIADIQVRHAPLKGVRVPPERAPSMIDEYPVLSVVAACATGETRMEGLAELKVKESDRLAATAAGLVANGIAAKVDGDTLIVSGTKTPSGGGTVVTHMDHRIAMAFLVLGLASARPVTVDDVTFVATSFPEFQDLMSKLGASFG